MFNPENSVRYNWISPFGNLFSENQHYYACVYGGNDNAASDERTNDAFLLEFQPNNTSYPWIYHSTVMHDSQIGFNEADIENIGSKWICISRSSDGNLYFATSSDLLNWTTPRQTPYRLGHSPDCLPYKINTDSASLFCIYRGDNGLFRGGKATYTFLNDSFWCEDKILYTARGNGGGDFGYGSITQLNTTTMGFIDYDVVMCGERGSSNTYSRILWQTWTIPQ
jgi:hypothetical protein